MEDIYERNASPFNRVFGDVDYVFVTRDYSDEVTQVCIQAVIDEESAADSEGVTLEAFKKGALHNCSPVIGGSFEHSWQRLIRQKMHEYSVEAEKGEPEQPQTSVEGAFKFEDIQTMQHTKKLHTLFVVRLIDRISKEAFNQLLTEAKKVGGYYSRFNRDGAIAGFHFKTESDAKAFMSAVA